MSKQHHEISKQVALTIRRKRENLNFSQEYMAAKLDIAQSTYHEMESGKSSITIDRLAAICQIFDISVNGILEDIPIESIPY